MYLHLFTPEQEVNAVETDPDNMLTCFHSGRIKENESSEHPEDFNYTHSPFCRVLTLLFQSANMKNRLTFKHLVPSTAAL